MPCGDARGGRVVFVSHCLLNANVKVCGLAAYAGAHRPVWETLLPAGVGVVQLPCPEFLHMGPARWWQTRSQYDTPAYRALCSALADSVADQALMYRGAGVRLLAVLGVEGSPSCGVNRVYDHAEWGGRPRDVDPAVAKRAGKGVWMEVLEQVFAQRGVALPPLLGVGSARDAAGGGLAALEELLRG
ncbi:CD3072 family TudS-related putative desulfidase [Desulfovibrio psychrotolerans]|uniref:DUF523 domain-containing protein n=1 Tax=Desulfovibrio psychrotolerans TaxID=415242 RepID=A0A7J0BXY7_9BACT|nr:CD3072 family TudS-related putative desulfidase [Desulfovibrio psychrotolerans]GFM37864.1 hypothetical protein DSM19430T_25480 [Desulfovibrio psychrotolerans]